MTKKVCDDKNQDNCHPLIKQKHTIQLKEVKTSRLLVKVTLLILSLLTFIIFWFTNLYNRILVQQILLKEGSEIMDFWVSLPMDPIIKISVFNYTNIQEVLSGAESKIKVKEIGPYTYREPLVKTMLDIKDDTISYFENRSHTFMPEWSEGLSEDDVIMVPNLALISGIRSIKTAGFFAGIMFKSILGSTKPREFQNITVAQYLHGFNDNFMSLIAKVKWDFKPEDIGLLALRRGVGKKRITVFSGTGDYHDVGRVHAINNQTMIDVWKTDDCNKVDGSDGTIFRPFKVQQKQDLPLYQPTFCRSLPMVFDGEQKVLNGITTYRYKPASRLFSSLESYPENKFFCELKSLTEKQVDGVLDVSGCLDGNPPILVSHPHFYEGSSKLFEHIEGLKPNKSLHHSLAHLHPRLSFPLKSALRMQLNIRVNSFGKYFSKNLPEGIILPVVWVETSTEDFPESMNLLLFLSTTFADYLELVFKFGSIFGIIFSSIKIFLTYN